MVPAPTTAALNTNMESRTLLWRTFGGWCARQTSQIGLSETRGGAGRCGRGHTTAAGGHKPVTIFVRLPGGAPSRSADPPGRCPPPPPPREGPFMTRRIVAAVGRALSARPVGLTHDHDHPHFHQ